MADRVRYVYAGDEPVSLHGRGSPHPLEVAPGDVFEVDADVAAESYASDDRFEPTDEDVSAPVDVNGEPMTEPVPRSVAEQVERDALVESGSTDGVLRGAALDDALRELGLPLSGTADEKRARLAEATGGPSPVDGQDA